MHPLAELCWQQDQKDFAASILQRWYHCYKLRRTITHRITQRAILNNKRANLQSICLGASIYANNIKAFRPPRDSSTPTTTAIAPQPPPTTHTHPFRHRGLPLHHNKKRSQTNRHRRTRQKKSRPRNRPPPPRKFRIGPSSSPMVSHLPSNILDTIDANQPMPTTASPDLSIIDESDSPLSKG